MYYEDEYGPNDYRSYLMHHGIKGQKWGDRNGPPYPLDASKHSAAELKAAGKRLLSSAKDGARNVSNKAKDEVAKLKKATSSKIEETKEKSAQRKEDKIKKTISTAIQKGDANTILKYSNRFTTNELNEAINRCRAINNLEQLSTSRSNEIWNKVGSITDKLNKVNNLANSIKNVKKTFSKEKKTDYEKLDDPDYVQKNHSKLSTSELMDLSKRAAAISAIGKNMPAKPAPEPEKPKAEVSTKPINQRVNDTYVRTSEKVSSAVGSNLNRLESERQSFVGKAASKPITTETKTTWSDVVKNAEKVQNRNFDAFDKYQEDLLKRNANKLNHSEDDGDIFDGMTADEFLEHHGILGQKWGVRRFQNKDGSLTAAGKKKYSRNELNKEQQKVSDAETDWYNKYSDAVAKELQSKETHDDWSKNIDDKRYSITNVDEYGRPQGWYRQPGTGFTDYYKEYGFKSFKEAKNYEYEHYDKPKDPVRLKWEEDYRMSEKYDDWIDDRVNSKYSEVSRALDSVFDAQRNYEEYLTDYVRHNKSRII